MGSRENLLENLQEHLAHACMPIISSNQPMEPGSFQAITRGFK